MTVCLITEKNAKCYYAKLQWKDKSGKWHTKSVSTGVQIKGDNKRKAMKKAEEIKAEFEEQQKKKEVLAEQDILFVEYFERWLTQQERFLKQSTYYGYQCIFEKHIKPYFKKSKIKLCDLTAQDIQGYYNHLMDIGLSAATVKRQHSNIRKSL